MRRRDVLVGAAALATIGLNPVAASAATRPRPGAVQGPSLNFSDYPVVARVRAQRALEHLRVLSDQIGPRIAGTEGELRAKDYIAGVLRGLRYQVTVQPFAIADKFLGSVQVGHDTWQTGSSPQGLQDVNREALVVDVGDGSTLPADLTGKIVLIAAVQNNADAYLLAAQRGAVAVLLGRIGPDPARRLGAFSPTLATPVSVPVLGLAQVQVERLRQRLAAGQVLVRASAVQHRNLMSHNVIAEHPGRDNGVVMVSAHYDSVPGSPGANDDGSGTVLCLELARVLRHLPTTKTVRFALWGAEEYGLLGSRHYVSQLTDADAQRIEGCFQNDMVATSYDPATVYWLLSVDGTDNATTQAVAAAAKRLGYDPSVRGPVARGSSDHVPFFERGIAAGNFSWRGETAPPSSNRPTTPPKTPSPATSAPRGSKCPWN